MKKQFRPKLIEELNVNLDKKIVACVSKDFISDVTKSICRNFGVGYNENKNVAIARTHPDDEFDKYVGSALAICYSLFGSKTQFQKYVDSNVDEYLTKKSKKGQKKKMNISK